MKKKTIPILFCLASVIIILVVTYKFHFSKFAAEEKSSSRAPLKIDKSKITLEPVDGQCAKGKMLLDSDDVPHFLYEYGGNVYQKSGTEGGTSKELLLQKATIHSMFQDPNKGIHAVIAKHVPDKKELYHFTMGVEGWQKVKLENISSYELKFAVDGFGHSHAMYVDGEKREHLRYATNAYGSWKFYNIAEKDYEKGFNFFSNFSFLVDHKGIFHLAYVYENEKDESGQLVYVTNKAESIKYSNIDRGKKFGFGYFQIFLDKKDNPHILFSSSRKHNRGFREELYYSKLSHGRWNTIRIKYDDAVAFRNIKACMDSNNIIHFISRDWNWTGNPLIYGRIKTGDAKVEKVTLKKGYRNKVGIFANADGQPVLIIHRGHKRKRTLVFVTKKGGDWKYETVSNHKGDISGLPLIDSRGNFHFLFRRRSPAYLFYMAKKYDLWTETLIAEGSEKQLRGQNIFIDKKKRIHIISSSNSKIRHAIKDKNGWRAETVDQGFKYSGWPATALDHKGQLHLVFKSHNYHTKNSPNDELFYAVLKDDCWEKMPLTKSDIEQEISRPVMVLDRKNKVHICFSEHNDLFYMTNKNGEWVKEQINEFAKVGFVSSIFADNNGIAHIAYPQRIPGTQNYELIYATNKNGDFDKLSISSSALNAKPAEIFVEENGVVHFVYNAFEPFGRIWKVMYTHNKSGDWKSETVMEFSAKMGIPNLSMAVDRKGNPVILLSDKALTLARKEGSKWTVYPIDYYSGWYWDIELEIDRMGNYHITCSNDSGIWHTAIGKESFMPGE